MDDFLISFLGSWGDNGAIMEIEIVVLVAGFGSGWGRIDGIISIIDMLFCSTCGSSKWKCLVGFGTYRP